MHEELPERDSQALTQLNKGLRAVLRVGLPIRPSTAPDELLKLPAVRARATTDDHLARVDALDRLIRGELRLLGLNDLRRSARALFGATKGGDSLTDRRRQAAVFAGYNLDHFRKRIEPKIVEQLAWQLLRLGLQYVRRRNGPEPIEASGDTPTIQDQHVTEAKTAEQEVLLSRIWSEVYGLRAELIARESARDDPERQDEFTDAATGSLWYLARLLKRLDEYLDKYGRTILHGAAEYDANALIRLAGWTGELTTQQAQELRFAMARTGEWDRPKFLESIRDSDEAKI
jgi:hypothetical protein